MFGRSGPPPTPDCCPARLLAPRQPPAARCSPPAARCTPLALALHGPSPPLTPLSPLSPGDHTPTHAKCALGVRRNVQVLHSNNRQEWREWWRRGQCKASASGVQRAAGGEQRAAGGGRGASSRAGGQQSCARERQRTSNHSRALVRTPGS